jgi:hypothetical protein
MIFCIAWQTPPRPSIGCKSKHRRTSSGLHILFVNCLSSLPNQQINAPYVVRGAREVEPIRVGGVCVPLCRSSEKCEAQENGRFHIQCVTFHNSGMLYLTLWLKTWSILQTLIQANVHSYSGNFLRLWPTFRFNERPHLFVRHARHSQHRESLGVRVYSHRVILCHPTGPQSWYQI